MRGTSVENGSGRGARFGGVYKKTHDGDTRGLEQRGQKTTLSARELLKDEEVFVQALRDFQAGNQRVKEQGWDSVAVEEFMRIAVDSSGTTLRYQVEDKIPEIVRGQLKEPFTVN